MDFDVNKVFRAAKKTKFIAKKRFLYWFMKHYFHCDIHLNDRIDNSVVFAHNALGVVINKDALIEKMYGFNIMLRLVAALIKAVQLLGGCRNWCACYFAWVNRNWRKCCNWRWGCSDEKYS